MKKRAGFVCFFTLIAFSVRAETNGLETDCLDAFTPDLLQETLVSPLDGKTFDQYVTVLGDALARYSRGDREELMLQFRDSMTGPSLSVRKALYDLLLVRFGYVTKMEKRRMITRSIDQNKREKMAYSTRVRELMRVYGETDPLYQTPQKLVDDIANMYRQLEDQDERETALGLLPSIDNFPPWGREVMRLAFKKLGYSRLEVWRMVRRLNHTVIRFPPAKVQNELYWNYFPKKFEYYKDLPTVARFISYITTAISNRTNFSYLARSAPVSEPKIEEPPKPVQTPPPPVREVVKERLALLGNLRILRNEITTIEKGIKTKTLPTWSRRQRMEGESYRPNAAEKTAAQLVNQYLHALGEVYVERDYLINALQYVFLTSGNVLTVGAGGIAKTAALRSALKGILVKGASSYAETQFNSHSSPDDFKGPLDPKILFDEGRSVRLYDQGVLQSHFVGFDEIDKAPPRLQPSLFNLLADRVDTQGPNSFPAITDIIIASQNKYISQMYLSLNISPQDVQPFIDRFHYVIGLPGELETIVASQTLAEDRLFSGTIDYEHLETLRSMLAKVVIPYDVQMLANVLFFEMRDQTSEEAQKLAEKNNQVSFEERIKNPAPYKSTKIYSPRTQKFMLTKFLPAVVLRRWMKNPESPLVASIEDLKELKNFLVMIGPDLESLEYYESTAYDPHEKGFYDGITFETETFDEAYRILAKLFSENRTLEVLKELADLKNKSIGAKTLSIDARIIEANVIGKKLKASITYLNEIKFPERNRELTAEHIFAFKNWSTIQASLRESVKSYQKLVQTFR